MEDAAAPAEVGEVDGVTTLVGGPAEGGGVERGVGAGDGEFGEVAVVMVCNVSAALAASVGEYGASGNMYESKSSTSGEVYGGGGGGGGAAEVDDGEMEG